MPTRNPSTPNRASMHVRLLRCLAASLWSMAVLGLIFPMPILADVSSAPDHFGMTYVSEGLSLEFSRHSDGGFNWVSSDGEQGHLEYGAIEGLQVLEANDVDGQMQVTVQIPDGVGGGSLYSFDGSAQADGSVMGWLGGLQGDPQWVRIDLQGGGSPQDVIDVIGPISAIGLIFCAVIAYYTDCLGDCGAACTNGMQSASEGFCGRCTCECKPSSSI